MKKENFKLSTIILLIFVILLSATYAYVVLSAKAVNTATGEGRCFEVNYTGQAINNSSLQSTTDYTQGATSQIVLSKNANCDIYETAQILIHTNSSTAVTTAPIDTVQALKYRIEVTSGDGKIIAADTGEETTSTTGVITTNKDDDGNDIGLPLTKVTLTETATTYTVYLWIDPEVSGGAFHGKTYSGYLYASATQSSTVTG